MSSDSADQSKPFVLSTSLGEFLRGTSNFFLAIALLFSFLEYFDMKVESNTVVFSMLLNAVVINVLLEINSRIVFAIVGFLTFLSVIGQLIMAFLLLFGGKFHRGAGTSQGLLYLSVFAYLQYPLAVSFVIVMSCLVLFVSIIIIIQLFCSAALFKLSGVMDVPEPPKKQKKSKKAKKTQQKTVDSLESARTDSTHSTTCTCSESETTR